MNQRSALICGVLAETWTCLQRCVLLSQTEKVILPQRHVKCLARTRGFRKEVTRTAYEFVKEVQVRTMVSCPYVSLEFNSFYIKKNCPQLSCFV